MTRPGRGPVRVRARVQLANELKTLRSAGARLAVLEPTDELMALVEGFPHRKGTGRAITNYAHTQTRTLLQQLGF